MDNFITDASMWKNDVDIALSNGFRFSPPIVPNETRSCSNHPRRPLEDASSQ